MDETTLVLLKPDAVQRGLVGELINRLERSGLKIVAMRMLHVDDDTALEHYHEHKDKPFFNSLKNFITSSPVVALALRGRLAIEQTRTLMGSTDPAKASPGTIRGDFGVDMARNLVHGSANTTDAKRELSIFFKKEELFGYSRAYDGWIEE